MHVCEADAKTRKEKKGKENGTVKEIKEVRVGRLTD